MKKNHRTTHSSNNNSFKPYINPSTTIFLPMPPSSQNDSSLKKTPKKPEIYWLTATLLKINTIKCFTSSKKPKVNPIAINLQSAATKLINIGKPNELYWALNLERLKITTTLPMVVLDSTFLVLSAKNKLDTQMQKTTTQGL